MNHLINIVFFLIGVGVIFYLIVKGLSKLSDMQQHQFEELIKKELRDNFRLEPIFFDYNHEYYKIDQILSSLTSWTASLFATNRKGMRPKRFVVEGNDNRGQPFLFAIVQAIPRFQSGGPRQYTFIYAIKGANIKDKNLLEQSSSICQIGEWVVVFKKELISGGYKVSESRFSDLKNQLNLVVN